MTRLQTRDKIRVEAGIPGDDIFDYLINAYLDEQLQEFTALRRYPECSVLGQSLTWMVDGAGSIPYALLPTDLQHLDVDNIRFYDGNFQNLLRPWSRVFVNQTNGDPFQWRRTTHQDLASAYFQVLQISPADNIIYPSNSIYIDYWRKLTWINDTVAFPIPRLEVATALKVVERIANLQTTGLAQRAANLAMQHYTAARAQNTGDM